MSKGCDSTCSAFIYIKGVMGTVLLCVYMCPLSPSHCVISPLNSQKQGCSLVCSPIDILLVQYILPSVDINQCLQIQIEIKIIFVKMYPVHM